MRSTSGRLCSAPEMDGTVDIRMVMTIAGMVASMAGAAAVAKAQIKQITNKLEDVEDRLRELARREDKLFTLTETQEQRLTVLSKLNSPETLRREHMQLATIIEQISVLQAQMQHMEGIHNSRHIPVASERKAD